MQPAALAPGRCRHRAISSSLCSTLVLAARRLTPQRDGVVMGLTCRTTQAENQVKARSQQATTAQVEAPAWLRFHKEAGPHQSDVL